MKHVHVTLKYSGTEPCASSQMCKMYWSLFIIGYKIYPIFAWKWLKSYGMIVSRSRPTKTLRMRWFHLAWTVHIESICRFKNHTECTALDAKWQTPGANDWTSHSAKSLGITARGIHSLLEEFARWQQNCADNLDRAAGHYPPRAVWECSSYMNSICTECYWGSGGIARLQIVQLGCCQGPAGLW